jgi:hypothetical protein
MLLPSSARNFEGSRAFAMKRVGVLILLYAAVWGAFFGMFSLEQNADDA